MALYIVRIELHHSADSDDYDILHSEMAKQGFSRQIQSGEGVVYDLPWAEYCISSSLEINQILQKAKAAAAATRLTYAALVSQTDQVMWNGLVKA